MDRGSGFGFGSRVCGLDFAVLGFMVYGKLLY